MRYPFFTILTQYLIKLLAQIRTLGEKGYVQSEVSEFVYVVKLFDECILRWKNETDIRPQLWMYIRKKLLNMVLVAILSEFFDMEEVLSIEDAASLIIPSSFSKALLKANLQQTLQQIEVEDTSDVLNFDKLKQQQTAELFYEVDSISKANMRVQVLKLLNLAILPDYTNEVLDFIANLESLVLPDVFLEVKLSSAAGVAHEPEWSKERAKSLLSEKSATPPSHQRKKSSGSASKRGEVHEQAAILRETVRNFNTKALSRDPIRDITAEADERADDFRIVEDEAATQAQYSSSRQRERGLCDSRGSAKRVIYHWLTFTTFDKGRSNSTPTPRTSWMTLRTHPRWSWYVVTQGVR